MLRGVADRPEDEFERYQAAAVLHGHLLLLGGVSVYEYNVSACCFSVKTENYCPNHLYLATPRLATLAMCDLHASLYRMQIASVSSLNPPEMLFVCQSA